MFKMYHNIVNVNPKDINAVIEFSSELDAFQKRNYDGHDVYEYYYFICEYMRTNLAMFTMMNVVNLVYNHNIICFKDFQTINDVNNIMTQQGIHVPMILNGIQSIDSNLDLFFDITSMAYAPYSADEHIGIMILEMLNTYTSDISRMLPTYYNRDAKFVMRRSEFLMIIELLEAVHVLINRKHDLISNHFDVFGTLAETATTYVIRFEDTEVRASFKYELEQELPSLMFKYILPAICLDIRGLYDVIYLIRRVRYYHGRL